MKPSISELFTVLWQFGLRNQTAGFNRVPWLESKQKLREDLERLGVADQFDWTEE